MKIRIPARVALVAAACAVVGAVAGIAGSAASTNHHAGARSAANAGAGPPGRRFGPDGHGPGGDAVHAQEVVLNKAGTAFVTATEDSGTVVSVSGDQLTIKEAAGSVVYNAAVTLTIPSGATVERNGSTAALTDLKSGDHVRVTQSSDGTQVFAGDGTAHPGGWGVPGGPPPGEPPAGG